MFWNTAKIINTVVIKLQKTRLLHGLVAAQRCRRLLMRLRHCAAQPADPSSLYKLLSCIFIYSNIMYELKSRPRLLKYGLLLKIESTRQIRLTHGLMVKSRLQIRSITSENCSRGIIRVYFIKLVFRASELATTNFSYFALLTFEEIGL